VTVIKPPSNEHKTLTETVVTRNVYHENHIYNNVYH
jgi:hypothetical protein